MAAGMWWAPDGHRIEFDPSPAPETRATLAREINAFHGRVTPYESERFGVILRDAGDGLAAGLIGVISWRWLFVEAVWVCDALRGLGVGRALMKQAETYALDRGCHSAWLDTFQARAFYISLGYEPFGMLEDYPPGQSRTFMRRRLKPLS